MTATFDKIARNHLLSTFNPKDFKYDGTPIRDMVVREINSELAREMISTFHYSQTFPDSTVYCYGGYLNGKLIGVVCYGMGCGKNQYTSIVPNIENGTYLELTRLWVANDMPRNSESKLIATSLKMLPKQYHLIISFADESQKHCGIIYQATNWYYLGVNGGGKMLIKNGIKKHPRLLGVYRMRHPELKDITNDELMKILGFELIPILTAFIKGFYEKHEDGIIFHSGILGQKDIEELKEVFGDYGKEWALTKEELL